MPAEATFAHLILTGRPPHLVGRLLADTTRAGELVPIDPETGDEDRDERPAFVLSTEDEAADGHVLRQHWDLSRASDHGPGVPVLWNHDQDALLGQWQDLAVRDLEDGPALVGRAYLDPDDPAAQHRRGQIRRGILSAVSVGWTPGEVTRRGDLDEGDPLYREPEDDLCDQPAEGLVMGSADRPNHLIEASLVACPAQPSAVVVERLHRAASRDLGGLDVPHRDIDALIAWLGQDPRVRAYLARLTGRLLDERLADRPPSPRALRDLLTR